MFPHGVWSAGIAELEDWFRLREFAGDIRLPATDVTCCPADFRALATYAAAIPPGERRGHSAGTQVAALAARQVPVTQLVLGSPTVDPAYRATLHVLRRWVLDGRREPSSLAPQQRQEWRQAGVRRILVLFGSMLRHRLEETVADLTCPITVIRGERDPLCTPQWARRLAEGNTLLTVPGLPHAFPYQDRVAFTKIILDPPSPRR